MQAINDRTVRRSTGLLETALDDELVALHLDQGCCYAFNATATRIWAMLENPTTVSEIHSRLVREFEVDEVTCARELDEVLAQLEQRGLVTTVAI